MILGVVCTPIGAPAQVGSPASAIERTTLENGVGVVVVENHTAPLATVLVSVQAGARIQDPGREGLAHLFEHILFRSYGRDPAAFAERAGWLNAAYNGATREEDVTYFLMLPSEHAEDGIELLADLVRSARFDDTDLESERLVVLDELARSASDPVQALERQVARRLWGEAWYARDVGGDSVSLASITASDMREAYARHYRPTNTAVFVTGDVSAPEVFEEVRRRFGSWRRRSEPDDRLPAPSPAPLAGISAVFRREAVPDVTIHIAFRGPALRADTMDTYAVAALIQHLNNPLSAPQQHLVTRGPFQWVQFRYAVRDGPSAITVTGRVARTGAIRALPTLIDALDGLSVLLDLTAENQVAVQKRRAVDAALTLERVATLAPTLASWRVRGGIAYYLSRDEQVDIQQPSDLLRAAERYIAGQPRVIGVLGSPAIIDRLAAQLGARQR